MTKKEREYLALIASEILKVERGYIDKDPFLKDSYNVGIVAGLQYGRMKLEYFLGVNCSGVKDGKANIEIS